MSFAHRVTRVSVPAVRGRHRAGHAEQHYQSKTGETEQACSTSLTRADLRRRPSQESQSENEVDGKEKRERHSERDEEADDQRFCHFAPNRLRLSGDDGKAGDVRCRRGLGGCHLTITRVSSLCSAITALRG